MLKVEIEKAYIFQQNLIKNKKLSTRREYLPNIIRPSAHVEVISGIRRCGKSTLMRQIIEQYHKPIAYFNFEDSRVYDFTVEDFEKLDELIGKGISAYFFDEIQNVDKWELYIRELHDRGEKIFITGSNASLLSKELGTRLTGRNIRHEIFPFSYKEFLVHKALENNQSNFDEYLIKGGFPDYLDYNNQDALQTLMKDVVLRDIAIRYGIRNTKTLMDISLFLLSNVGKECTYNSIRKSFNIGSANSVVDYLSWLSDSYLLFFVNKFSWSLKAEAYNPRKVYAIDNGLVNACSLSYSDDYGRLLENAVFLHLRRNFDSIHYFKEKNECDFIVFDKNKFKYLIQVCAELHSDNKERELNGLLEAMEFFKIDSGYIITLKQKDIIHYKDKQIKLMPAYEFFMQ